VKLSFHILSKRAMNESHRVKIRPGAIGKDSNF